LELVELEARLKAMEAKLQANGIVLKPTPTQAKAGPATVQTSTTTGSPPMVRKLPIGQTKQQPTRLPVSSESDEEDSEEDEEEEEEEDSETEESSSEEDDDEETK
jgi:hypothetical protein